MMLAMVTVPAAIVVINLDVLANGSIALSI